MTQSKYVNRKSQAVGQTMRSLVGRKKNNLQLKRSRPIQGMCIVHCVARDLPITPIGL